MASWQSALNALKFNRQSVSCHGDGLTSSRKNGEPSPENKQRRNVLPRFIGRKRAEGRDNLRSRK